MEGYLKIHLRYVKDVTLAPSRLKNIFLWFVCLGTIAWPTWGQETEDSSFLPENVEEWNQDQNFGMDESNSGSQLPRFNVAPNSSKRSSSLPESLASSQSLGKSETGEVLSAAQKLKLSQAGIEEITDDNFPEMIESFDFPNADITEVAKAISELTGKNFIIDPGVRGKITIIAPSKITVAEAFKAFLSALAINGYAVVPSGKFWKIRSARNAQRDGIETYSGRYYPNYDQMITRIIHLKHVSAEAINRELRILISKDGEMSVYAPTNSLIISDYGSNIDRIMKIVAELDVPGFNDQLEVIPVKYAKAKDIADLMNKILNKDNPKSSGSGGVFQAGVPRFGRTTPEAGTPTGGGGSPYFMVIPDERSNSLIVVGNKAGIERVKDLLKRLDFPIKADENGGVYVYYVKYGDAEKIAQTLNFIAKEAASPPPGSGSNSAVVVNPTTGVQQAVQSIFGSNVKINADKGTNSIVIVASKQDYEVILGLLGKLDIPRDQVYVEAIIMEMKHTNALDWQIGYFQFDKNGSVGRVGFNGFKGDTLGALLNPIGGNGAILGFGSKDIITITPPNGNPIQISSLVGFINFLKTYTNANILSTPQILAMDNQEAEIEVGDRVVTGQNVIMGIQGQTQAAPIFEDATIKLKIKPFISPASNAVRMELVSQVKQISTAKTPPGLVNFTQPLATRSIKTNIVIPDQDTAVLGGLMKEDQIETVQKVPLLGDLPILGWLFKSRGVSKEKTNLLVFLTPKIIRNSDQSRQLLGEKLKQRLKFIKQSGGKDPFGAKIDEISASRPNTSLDEDYKNKDSNKTANGAYGWDQLPDEIENSEVKSQ